MQQIYIASYFKNGYHRFMQYIQDILNHPGKELIEKRLEIIKFFDEFGPAATRKAFQKSRSTIFLWKQKLKQANGKLSALAPGNTTPLHKRKRLVHPFIETFILQYRLAHPGADKTTITPPLAEACQQAAIKPVSESTVGRIIHDLKERGKLSKSLKMIHKGDTGKLYFHERKPAKKKPGRKGYTPTRPGDLVQMDTIAIFANGLKRYLFTALDVNSRMAFAYAYKANTSANGRDFLRKFVKVTPFVTTHIQTDNGSEFAQFFDKDCQENDLLHFFNYPRHPQSNAYVERFNRTLQEQFVNWHIDELEEVDTFNRNLMEYLIWYNTEKPHRGIGNLAPLRYYLDNYFMNPQKSNMLWTLTSSCRRMFDRVNFPSVKSFNKFKVGFKQIVIEVGIGLLTSLILQVFSSLKIFPEQAALLVNIFIIVGNILLIKSMLSWGMFYTAGWLIGSVIFFLIGLLEGWDFIIYIVLPLAVLTARTALVLKKRLAI